MTLKVTVKLYTIMIFKLTIDFCHKMYYNIFWNFFSVLEEFKEYEKL